MTRTHSRTCSLVVAAAIAVASPAVSLAQDKTPATGSKATTTTNAKAGDTVTLFTPMLVLLPTTVAVDDATKNGCWVKLYDQKNYAGDSFTLGGPIELAQMKGPFGFDWENKVKSLQTGPKTTVTIFDNRNFKEQDKRIAPSSKVADLSKQMGYFDDFRSMKVACA